MPRFGQIVIGPAGCGKSTYCHTIQAHCESVRHPCKVINLDPAAEKFEYTPAGDIRDLIEVFSISRWYPLLSSVGATIILQVVENSSKYIGSSQDYVLQSFIHGFVAILCIVPVYAQITDSTLCYLVLIKASFFAFIGAILIDVDHFIVAESFSLKGAINLKGRPFLHWFVGPIIFWTLYIYAFLFLRHLGVKYSSIIWFYLASFLIAWTSHLCRDAIHAGIWLWPPPSLSSGMRSPSEIVSQTPLPAWSVYFTSILLYTLVIPLIFQDSSCPLCDKLRTRFRPNPTQIFPV